jgi:TDG/mug DNA glycosylase family protein
VIGPNLKVIFVGINPGIYSAAAGHHFAHPANRFWRALYDGGFTPRLFSPFENEELLKLGYGLTNIVEQPTLQADELSKDELLKGWQKLEIKAKKFQPRWLAICGIGAYRMMFGRNAQVGEQEKRIDDIGIWLLPNPSGLSASFTPKRLAEVFRELKEYENCPVVTKLDDNSFLKLISAAVFQAVIPPEAAIRRWNEIKRAFNNFDVDIVAQMDESDIDKLLQNEKIIRNQKKIQATVENAKEVTLIKQQFGSVGNYLKQFENNEELLKDLDRRIHYIGRPSLEWVIKCLRK